MTVTFRALTLALVVALALAAGANAGCSKKTDPRGYHAPKPTQIPYRPKPLPTAIWPTPRPGQPPMRPTMPG